MTIDQADAALRARYELLGVQRGHTRTRALLLDGPVIQARVEHNRWLADCPWCRSAILVAPGDPFWCPDCGNAAVDGADVEVLWPPNPDEIAAVLERRPLAHRHWYPDETVDDLDDENAAAGVADATGAQPGGSAWRHAFIVEFDRRKRAR